MIVTCSSQQIAASTILKAIAKKVTASGLTYDLQLPGNSDRLNVLQFHPNTILVLFIDFNLGRGYCNEQTRFNA